MKGKGEKEGREILSLIWEIWPLLWVRASMWLVLGAAARVLLRAQPRLPSHYPLPKTCTRTRARVQVLQLCHVPLSSSCAVSPCSRNVVSSCFPSCCFLLSSFLLSPLVLSRAVLSLLSCLPCAACCRLCGRHRSHRRPPLGPSLVVEWVGREHLGALRGISLGLPVHF